MYSARYTHVGYEQAGRRGGRASEKISVPRSVVEHEKVACISGYNTVLVNWYSNSHHVSKSLQNALVAVRPRPTRYDNTLLL
jgi:hypothetical protein